MKRTIGVLALVLAGLVMIAAWVPLWIVSIVGFVGGVAVGYFLEDGKKVAK